MSIRKKINLLFLLGVIAFLSCNKEDNDNNNTGSNLPTRGVSTDWYAPLGDRVSISFTTNGSFSSSGICWANTPTPTINDYLYEYGPVNDGTYSLIIAGLTPMKTYHVRAYASDTEGTIYGNEISFTMPSVSLGESFGGGVVGYILQPEDPGYEPNAMHGFVAQLVDRHTQIAWGCEGTLTGASGTTIGTGILNKSVLIPFACYFPQDQGIYPPANINYNDWYVPSKDELYKIYLNKNVIPELQQFGFNPSTNYWSSSEADANSAWAISFNTGSVYENPKSSGNPGNIRLIRSF
jgi:hypothetical protein